MERTKKIHNSRDLKQAIADLELKKDADELILKSQFKETYNTYKPANILKNTIEEVSASPRFRHNLLNVAIGLGAGYLSKKLVIGKSAGLLKRAAGTALQYGITALVAKKARDVEDHMPQKKKGFLKKLFSR
ncbi:MAG: hypothetical protein ABJA57_05635 [Ginsengibacter sp.]